MITIPEDVITSLKLPEKDREKFLKVELAIALYQRRNRGDVNSWHPPVSTSSA